MSTEANKNIIRRYMAEGVNQGKVSIADQLFTSNFVFHFAGSPALDRAGWAQTTSVFHTGFPDQHTMTEELIAEGEQVAARFTFSGTHRGEFQGIAPTGKSVTMSGMAFWRMMDGKIAEHWVETDSVGLLQQLGVIPTAAQGS